MIKIYRVPPHYQSKFNKKYRTPSHIFTVLGVWFGQKCRIWSKFTVSLPITNKNLSKNTVPTSYIYRARGVIWSKMQKMIKIYRVPPHYQSKFNWNSPHIFTVLGVYIIPMQLVVYMLPRWQECTSYLDGSEGVHITGVQPSECTSFHAPIFYTCLLGVHYHYI